MIFKKVLNEKVLRYYVNITFFSLSHVFHKNRNKWYLHDINWKQSFIIITVFQVYTIDNTIMNL